MSVFAASDTVVEFELVYEQYDEYDTIQYRKLFMDVLEKSFGKYLKYRASGVFAVETEEEADIRVSYSRDDLSMRIEGIVVLLTTEEESNSGRRIVIGRAMGLTRSIADGSSMLST